MVNSLTLNGRYDKILFKAAVRAKRKFGNRYAMSVCCICFDLQGCSNIDNGRLGGADGEFYK